MNCDFVCHDCHLEAGCPHRGLTSHEARDELISEELIEEAVNDAALEYVQHQLAQVAAQYGDCHRCGGKGIIEAYRHVDGGRCWGCSGTGKVKKESEVEFKNEDVLLFIQSTGMYKGRPCLKGLLSIKGQVFRWVAQAKYNKIYIYNRPELGALSQNLMCLLKDMKSLGVLKDAIGHKMNLLALMKRIEHLCAFGE